MAYASQKWTKDLMSEVLKGCKDRGLLGSGGGNVYRKETVLWEGALSTVQSISLADEYDKYDELIFIHQGLPDAFATSNIMLIQSSISTKCLLEQNNAILLCGYDNRNLAVGPSPDDKTVLLVHKIVNEGLKKVIGVNYQTEKSSDLYYSYEDYTTDEICIGKWIDGRPIYRRILEFSNITMSNSSGYAHGIQNFNECISIKAYTDFGRGWESSDSGIQTTASSFYSGNFIEKNGVLYWNSSTSMNSSSTRKYKLFIEYTKTTDAENSFAPNMITNIIAINNPIGTITSNIGKTAPSGYLACNGSTYNISSYPELAEYIKTSYDSYNYFGGDGETTFAVPNLYNENEIKWTANDNYLISNNGIMSILNGRINYKKCTGKAIYASLYNPTERWANTYIVSTSLKNIDSYNSYKTTVSISSDNTYSTFNYNGITWYIGRCLYGWGSCDKYEDSIGMNLETTYGAENWEDIGKFIIDSAKVKIDTSIPYIKAK